MDSIQEASPPLESQRLALERARHRADIAKWIVAAIGAAVSFGVIDYGKLRLERERSAAENQRLLLQAYLTATESAQPDIWRRKLHVLTSLVAEDRVREWARAELSYIDDFAAKDALYRETLRVASQLVTPSKPDDSERVLARKRFEQLYWADLPYIHESAEVEDAMVKFRRALLGTEKSRQDVDAWTTLDSRLLELSKVLRASTPMYSNRCSGLASLAARPHIVMRPKQAGEDVVGH
jgi:hypothetical protein